MVVCGMPAHYPAHFVSLSCTSGMKRPGSLVVNKVVLHIKHFFFFLKKGTLAQLIITKGEKNHSLEKGAKIQILKKQNAFKRNQNYIF